MPRSLVIVRHAERVSGPDAGLSDAGRAQAEAISRQIVSRFPGVVPTLLTSPRRRCQETVAPLARATGARSIVTQALDEGGDAAWKADEIFVAWWAHGDAPVTVLCTHADIVPVLIERLIGRHVELVRGGMAFFEGDPEKLALIEIVQRPS